ncbi:MAG: Crp/Fnr family transcriptional regulator [Bacteroidota bacterium]
MCQFLTEYYGNAGLSAGELAELLAIHQPVRLKRGATLLQIGQWANAYWIVEDGLLRSYVISQAGDDLTTNFFARSEIALDFTGFFLHEQSLEGIEVLSEAKLWKVKKEDFSDFMHRSSAFGKWGRNWMVCSLIARQRFHLSYHTHTAKERYEALREQRPIVNQLAPLKYIASYIGVTDSTLSRLRKM